MSDICNVCGTQILPEDPYCKTCYANDMDEYRTVREYLRNYPNSNAMQVANATGISVSKIMKYIKNGSLTVVDEGRRQQR